MRQSFLHSRILQSTAYTATGPYYGQGNWFKHLHPEKVPSAVERYVKEIKRVTSVLNKELEDKTWLVGGKCTYADLAFITWQDIATKVVLEPGDDLAEQFPNVQAWLLRMKERPAVKETLAEYARKMGEVHGNSGSSALEK
jgi:glutathione S-transferase